MLVILNWPRVVLSSDVEITGMIPSELYFAQYKRCHLLL